MGMRVKHPAADNGNPYALESWRGSVAGSGLWYPAGGIQTTTAPSGNTFPVADRIYALAIGFPEDLTFSGLGFRCGNAANALSVAGIAVYRCLTDGSLYPGALLGEVNNLDVSTVGWKSGNTAAPVQMEAGDKAWLAISWAGAGAFGVSSFMLNAPPVGIQPTLGWTSAEIVAGTVASIYWNVADAYGGSFPATFPAGAVRATGIGNTDRVMGLWIGGW